MPFIKLCVLLILSIFTSLFLTTAQSQESDDLISVFPLDHYDQTLTTWIKPDSEDYDKPLLSEDMQKQHVDRFQKRYLSPWDPDTVNRILQQVPPDDLKSIEKGIIAGIISNNENNTLGYGENYRPYDDHWIEAIRQNMNLDQFAHLSYHRDQRGIAVDNLNARALPTDDVHFYSHKRAGQGYPFDTLQISSVWAGTPVYIVGETKDHAWSLVITPDYVGWVKSKGIAKTTYFFVNKWQYQTKKQLAAITRTQTSLLDRDRNFLLSAYIGSVFPAYEVGHDLTLMVPVADEDRNATIKYVTVSNDAASIIPLSATPHHFAKLISTLQNRPYGWGNMYFYNDCSGELKNLFTPFGIWLPRHSSKQVLTGRMVDMSAAAPADRLAYLMNKGRKFLTIVHINGHVFLYIGNHIDPITKTSMVMTYQNLWGLKPHKDLPNRRAIIGQAAFFPLLLQYPEDTTLNSQANSKVFQVAFLDEPPDYLEKLNMDLRAMMGV